MLTHPIDPGSELCTVCVCAVPVDDHNLRAERNLIAKDTQQWPPFHDPASERMLGLETDDEHCVSRIRRPLRKVVQDAATFDHA